jgi:nitrogen fixation NifU-like protein
MGIEDIYTQIIAEKSRSTTNRHHLATPTDIVAGKNPTCGDEITLEIDRDSNTIKDISFVGSGCAISQASTSMMIDLVRGKTIPEARNAIEEFHAMITEGELTDETMATLQDACALSGISHMPARVKCAILPWHTLSNALDEAEGKD